MGYSTRHLEGQPSHDRTKSENHEKVDVTVWRIDGTIFDVVKRTVFINMKGNRYVSYAGKQFELRIKKGVENSFVLPVTKTKKTV